MNSDGFKVDRFKIDFEVWATEGWVDVWEFPFTPHDMEVQSFSLFKSNLVNIGSSVFYLEHFGPVLHTVPGNRDHIHL